MQRFNLVSKKEYPELKYIRDYHYVNEERLIIGATKEYDSLLRNICGNLNYVWDDMTLMRPDLTRNTGVPGFLLGFWGQFFKGMVFWVVVTSPLWGFILYKGWY